MNPATVLAIIGIIVGLVGIVVALIIKGIDYFFGTIEQMIKQIYKWVSNIRNNLKSVLEKMGITWSIKTEELPKSRAQELLEGGISNKLKSTIDSIIEFLVNYTREFYKGLYKELSKPLMMIVGALTAFAKGYWNIILKIREAIYKFFSEKIIKSFNSVVDKGKEGYNKIKEKGKEFLGFGESGDKELLGTPAEEDPVMTKLNTISNQVAEINSSLQAKQEKDPADNDMAEIKEMFQRIEAALGLSDIAAALEELKAELHSIIQPVGEGEGVAAAGEKLDAIEAKLAENEAKLAEQTNDLGIEVRDSRRSIISEIDSVKSSLEALIKEIEKKAMTFDQIYKKLCVTIVREHRNATGRILR